MKDLLVKIPPHSEEIEQAILGAILLEKDAFDRASEFIHSEMFYLDKHQEIYKACTALLKAGKPIDSTMVGTYLKDFGTLEKVGGRYYITTLTNHVVSSAHLESHCKVLTEHYIKRELIRMSGEVIKKAYEGDDAFELLEEAEQSFGSIGKSLNYGDMVGIDSVLVDAMKQIHENMYRDNPITGVPTGNSDIDFATRGWQPGDLIILAARPSVGKTAMALNIGMGAGEHFADKGKYVCIWSLEMKSVKMVLRMMAAKSGKYLYALQTGRLTEHDTQELFEKGVQQLAKLPIRFDDTTGLNMAKLKAKCRKMHRKGELGIVIVDYLQLITPNPNTKIREQQISEISRELKKMAMEMDVPVIALAQLNRDVEKRTTNVPMVSDLRESGAIEQDADVITLLYAASEAEISEDIEKRNRRYLKIAKQRDGILKTIELEFKEEIQLFSKVAERLPEGFQPGRWRPINE